MNIITKDSELDLQNNGKFKAFIAEPESPRSKLPGLILIQEIWGMTDHIKDVAQRFAKENFLVVAPDLLGDTGILEKIDPKLFADMAIPEKRHEAQAKWREMTQPLYTKEFAESAHQKLSASFDYLKNNSICNKNIGVLGFCFGGTYSFFFATKELGLKACVAFYGQPPNPIEDVVNIQCPVLALYGEKDERLMTSLPALEEAMKKYGKNFTHYIYPNTGHAFFNDTNARAYNKEAAEKAWTISLKFLRDHLG